MTISCRSLLPLGRVLVLCGFAAVQADPAHAAARSAPSAAGPAALGPTPPSPATARMEARRCLRVPASAGSRTAFAQQLCLVSSGLGADGRLRLTLRGLFAGAKLPPLRLYAGASPQPVGEVLTISEVSAQTPLDVVAVVMMARGAEDWPDSSEAMRQGLLSLMRSTFEVADSRFGIVGYTSDRGSSPLQLPADAGPLLDRSHQPELEDALRKLQVPVHVNQTKWFMSNAVAKAAAMLEASAHKGPPHRQALLLFSDGVDSDAATAEQILSLIGGQAERQRIAVLYVPPPGHDRPIVRRLQTLLERTGGLIFANSTTTAELTAHFAALRAMLHKDLVVDAALENRSDENPDPLWLGLADGQGSRGEQLLSLSLAPLPAREGAPPLPTPPEPAVVTLLTLLWVALTLAVVLAGALLLRRMLRRTATRPAARTTPPAPSTQPIRAFLHWVERGCDIVVEQLPHHIGNSLDCDTITLGVGSPKRRAVLMQGDTPSSFFLRAIDPESVRDAEQRVQSSLHLEDGAEFFINQQRFKLFVTQLSTPERGA